MDWIGLEMTELMRLLSTLQASVAFVPCRAFFLEQRRSVMSKDCNCNGNVVPWRMT